MSRANVDYQGVPSANRHPSLLWPWLVLSAIWIAGVFFFEAPEESISWELVEVIVLAFLPPLVPPLLLSLMVRVLAGCFRP
jgi:hypothetical protein